MTPPADTRSAEIERVFREAHGQAVATLARVFGDLSLAEDAVQDAFAVAIERWRRDGLPANPAGWIVTTARRRAIDVVRRAQRGRRLYEEIAATMEDEHTDPTDEVVPDDQLRLIFTCCHPALRVEHRVALTLRLLGGLSVEEIARSFLVGESAMAKRLVRAKYKIAAARIPYRVPSDADLPDRLKSVLAVVYLIYNTGADDPGRAALRADAIRLGRSLAALMPDEPEVAGLLALMLLAESRMAARLADDDVVVLADQDRSRWDRTLIDEGHAIVRACVRRDRPGPYQLQAAIQAVHCDADTFSDTDWPQIVALYDQLLAFVPTPVVALNRAIAVAEVGGPEAGLEALDGLDRHLGEYHLFHAARGNLLRRLGEHDRAAAEFALARDLATHEHDIRFLEGELTR